MDMSGHLLYIDITQICGIGCNFCMYEDRHRIGAQLELSKSAEQNISRLINHPSVKRISISGEGEPLNNTRAFHAILGLSRGKVAFEFITSGFFPPNRLADFYDETEALLRRRGDTCNIRLSTDSYHIEKIRHKPHGASLQRALKDENGPLTFSFRSVDTDRTFTRNYLLGEAKAITETSRVVYVDPLADQLIINERTFAIDYKSHVHPSSDVPSVRVDMQTYINIIESRIGKRFTLGSLNPAPQHNGLDLTIKPSGNVSLYGIEHIPLGNIHTNSFSWEELVDRVCKDPFLSQMHEIPFVDMISRIDDKETVGRLVKSANNPYWLLKEFDKHPKLLEQMTSK